MAAMRSPLTAKSAAYQGLPAPSMMWPLRMMRSYSSGRRRFERGVVGRRRDFAQRLSCDGLRCFGIGIQ